MTEHSITPLTVGNAGGMEHIQQVVKEAMDEARREFVNARYDEVLIGDPDLYTTVMAAGLVAYMRAIDEGTPDG